MKPKEIWQLIEVCRRADKMNNPNFPDHAAGMAGRIIAPAGKLMELSMSLKYDDEATRHNDDVTKQMMRNAAIETAAKAIRFLENLK